MNILQVISYFYPAWSYGGPGKLVYDLSCALSKRGHEVTVYTTDAFDRLRRRTNSDNFFLKESKFKVVFLKNISNFLSYKFKFFLPVDFVGKVREEISKFDVVHIHEFFTPLNFVISGLANKCSIPYIISAHGTLDEYHLRHRRLIKSMILNIYGNKILEKATKMVAATSDEIREYQALGVKKSKIAYIPNGVDLTEFSQMPQRGLFRKKYRVDRDEKLIVYLGRIHKLKGLGILTEAFAKLIKLGSFRLVIIGSDDGYLDILKKRVQNLGITRQIILTGVLSGESKKQVYRDGDIFAYPSPSEGFSVAILEAAAAGLPLLITTGCKFPEVEKYHAGIITRPNIEEFYYGLKKMIEEKDLKKMGQNAQTMVRKNYSIDVMAERLERLYEEG